MSYTQTRLAWTRKHLVDSRQNNQDAAKIQQGKSLQPALKLAAYTHRNDDMMSAHNMFICTIVRPCPHSQRPETAALTPHTSRVMYAIDAVISTFCYSIKSDLASV